MKRCPQCEFIYEESQDLCDMDGTELIHDPREIPQHRLARRKKAVTSMLQLLAMALPAVALSALVFFGSSGPVAESGESDFNATPALKQSDIKPTTSSAMKSTSAAGAVDVISTPHTQDVSSEKSGKLSTTDATRQQTSDDSSTASQDDLSSKKGPEDRQESRKSKPVRAMRDRNWERNQTPKKDSKIGSLLKKTGRFLKKPFQM